jgi:hypothetical protein
MRPRAGGKPLSLDDKRKQVETAVWKVVENT